MRILALNLWKNKSVGCELDTATNKHAFVTVRTRPREIYDPVVEYQPNRVVIEIGPQAGWLYDLVTALGIEVQAANPNHEAWRWRKVCRTSSPNPAVSGLLHGQWGFFRGCPFF